MSNSRAIALLIVALVVGFGLAVTAWRIVRARRRRRHVDEDILKQLHQSERQGRAVQLDLLSGMLGVPQVHVRAGLDRVIERGWVRAEGATLHLTDPGRTIARGLARSHRILETYLADRTGHPSRAWHRLADRLEHHVSPEEIEQMARSLGSPVRDPHGDVIPDASGRMAEAARIPLALMPIGSVVRVVHVEDEPDVVYRDLLDHGIVPNAELVVLASDGGDLRVHVAGRGEQDVEALAAAQVDVTLSDAAPDELRELRPLSELPLGHSGRIVLLTSELRGESRRRLLDLGFTPGAVVTPLIANALGRDPTAFLIRQSKIALRRDQSRHVLVVPEEVPVPTNDPTDPAGSDPASPSTPRRRGVAA